MPQHGAQVTTSEQLHRTAARGAHIENPRGLKARLWIDKQPGPELEVVDGVFRLRVPAKGIAALIIDGVAVRPAFQEGFADLSQDDAWVGGHIEWENPAARALLLNFGSSYRTFFFHLKDGKRDFRSLRLRYEIDGRHGEVYDKAFPWEFTVPLGAEDRSILFKLDATRPDGSVESFGPGILSRKAGGTKTGGAR